MQSKLTAFLASTATALSFVFSGVAQAQELAPVINVKGVEFPLVGQIDLPECKTAEGVSANYTKYSETDSLVMSPLGSSGVGWDGKPEIIYDEEWIPYIPEIAQHFVFSHECSHVKRGHLGIKLGIKKQFRAGEITGEELDVYEKAFEDEADCDAISDLKTSHGLTIDGIDLIVDKITPMLKYYGAEDEQVEARRTHLKRCYTNNSPA